LRFGQLMVLFFLLSIVLFAPQGEKNDRQRV
jgi:hypothetical protein